LADAVGDMHRMSSAHRAEYIQAAWDIVRKCAGDDQDGHVIGKVSDAPADRVDRRRMQINPMVENVARDNRYLAFALDGVLNRKAEAAVHFLKMFGAIM
jgi:hypothetical protein